MTNNSTPLPDAALAELDRLHAAASKDYANGEKCLTENVYKALEFANDMHRAYPALRQRLLSAETRLAEAEREREASSAEVYAIKAAVDSLWAGTWDAHYGNGISAEYARSVEKQLRTALDAKIAGAWLSARDAHMKRDGAAAGIEQAREMLSMAESGEEADDMMRKEAQRLRNGGK